MITNNPDMFHDAMAETAALNRPATYEVAFTVPVWATVQLYEAESDAAAGGGEVVEVHVGDEFPSEYEWDAVEPHTGNGIDVVDLSDDTNELRHQLNDVLVHGDWPAWERGW